MAFNRHRMSPTDHKIESYHVLLYEKTDGLEETSLVDDMPLYDIDRETFAKYSDFHDWVGSRVFNPAQHLTMDCSHSKPFSKTLLSESDTHFSMGVWLMEDYNPPKFSFEAFSEIIPPLSSEVVGMLCARALKQALEQIPEVVKLPVLLKEMQESIESILPSLELLKQKWSSLYLQGEFGVKPFLNDLKKIFGPFQRVFDRLLHLIRTLDKEYTVRRRWVLEEEVDPLPLVSFLDTRFPSETDTYVEMEAVKFTRTLYLTLVVKNNLKGLEESGAFFKVFMHSLGMDNLYANLWEAQPFSWLVDWFVDIGSLLDSLSKNVFEGSLDLRAGYHTVKTEIDYLMIQKSYSDYIRADGLGELKVIHYDRRVGFPLTADDLFNLALDGHQSAIVGALIDQRKRRVSLPRRFRKLWKRIGRWIKLH